MLPGHLKPDLFRKLPNAFTLPELSAQINFNLLMMILYPDTKGSILTQYTYPKLVCVEGTWEYTFPHFSVSNITFIDLSRFCTMYPERHWNRGPIWCRPGPSIFQGYSDYTHHHCVLGPGLKHIQPQFQRTLLLATWWHQLWERSIKAQLVHICIECCLLSCVLKCDLC